MQGLSNACGTLLKGCWSQHRAQDFSATSNFGRSPGWPGGINALTFHSTNPRAQAIDVAPFVSTVTRSFYTRFYFP
jgi:hypothetical protein